jgi:hypothetical protein
LCVITSELGVGEDVEVLLDNNGEAELDAVEDDEHPPK